jgi:hypothetical protein
MYPGCDATNPRARPDKRCYVRRWLDALQKVFANLRTFVNTSTVGHLTERAETFVTLTSTRRQKEVKNVTRLRVCQGQTVILILRFHQDFRVHCIASSQSAGRCASVLINVRNTRVLAPEPIYLGVVPGNRYKPRTMMPLLACAHQPC